MWLVNVAFRLRRPRVVPTLSVIPTLIVSAHKQFSPFNLPYFRTQLTGTTFHPPLPHNTHSALRSFHRAQGTWILFHLLARSRADLQALEISIKALRTWSRVRLKLTSSRVINSSARYHLTSKASRWLLPSMTARACCLPLLEVLDLSYLNPGSVSTKPPSANLPHEFILTADKPAWLRFLSPRRTSIPRVVHICRWLHDAESIGFGRFLSSCTPQTQKWHHQFVSCLLQILNISWACVEVSTTHHHVAIHSLLYLVLMATRSERLDFVAHLTTFESRHSMMRRPVILSNEPNLTRILNSTGDRKLLFSRLLQFFTSISLTSIVAYHTA